VAINIPFVFPGGVVLNDVSRVRRRNQRYFPGLHSLPVALELIPDEVNAHEEVAGDYSTTRVRWAVVSGLSQPSLVCPH
jgi:hypothetical protein